MEGTPPSQYSAIQDAMVEKSKQDDRKSFPCDWYFEIPVQLARSLSGFDYSKGFVLSEVGRKPRGYYDEDDGDQEDEFEVLELD